MQKLKSTDLMPLEQYARERSAFRARVLERDVVVLNNGLAEFA